MFEETIIPEIEALSILNKEENHFFDFTSKLGDGKTLQKKTVAFANTDGGEIFVGIIDRKNFTGIDPIERWDGFKDVEEANSAVLNAFKEITPQIGNLYFEFYLIKGHEERGKVLKITIEKSTNIHYTSDKKVWIRKSAQCIECIGDAILNLKLSKGVSSYETQIVNNYEIKELIESKAFNQFLQLCIPKTDPLIFLKRERLINIQEYQEKPTYGAILLFDENPSATLPKKCAVKIARYKTSEIDPQREHLDKQESIEGYLYDQIEQSINVIQQIVESTSVLGPLGLEKAKYPPEAIKEIVVNAIIHRDYNISDDVLILIFNNRIEVHSPGILPGHITEKNILQERFARNPKIVRLLNKYPNPPNKDMGEGLNTAFQKMRAARLKEPIIRVHDNKVIVTLPHEYLATPEEQILEYLNHNKEINNKIGRELTGIGSENKVKMVFNRLAKRNLIERVPGKLASKAAWQKKG